MSCFAVGVGAQTPIPLRIEGTYTITYNDSERRSYQGSSILHRDSRGRLFVEVTAGSGALMALFDPLEGTKYWEDGGELPVKLHNQGAFSTSLAALSPLHLDSYIAYLRAAVQDGKMTVKESRSAKETNVEFEAVGRTNQNGSYQVVNHVFVRSGGSDANRTLSYQLTSTHYPSGEFFAMVERKEIGGLPDYPEISSSVYTVDYIAASTSATTGGFSANLVVRACSRLPDTFDLDVYIDEATPRLVPVGSGPTLHDLSSPALEAERRVSRWQWVLGLLGASGLMLAVLQKFLPRKRPMA